MTSRFARALAASIVLLGCAPSAPEARPQWTVVVSTDAPVPQFGDRVLAELLDQDGALACDGCRRQFGVTAADFPLSFGVRPPNGTSRYDVHVQLYRAIDSGGDGLPGSDRRIDALAELPHVDSLQRVGVELRMACFGQPSDRAERLGCDPTTGAIAPVARAPAIDGGAELPVPGSWPPAAEVTCETQPPAGMTCIPGGVFLLGDPRLGFGFVGVPKPEQLVQLSPFALDTDELTVGQLRELVLGHGAPEPISRDAASDIEKDCTWLGSSDSSNDALPVNCVSRSVAEQACAVQGKRLPTEAEWEFAAGNRDLETRYPWGVLNDAANNENVCAHALVAHDYFEHASGSTTCRGAGSPAGLVPGGHPDDLTQLGVHNMAGSVAEWVADKYEPYGGSCWPREVKLLVDPMCDTSSETSLRGGDWLALPAKAVVHVRDAVIEGLPGTITGIRCAMSL